MANLPPVKSPSIGKHSYNEFYIPNSPSEDLQSSPIDFNFINLYSIPNSPSEDHQSTQIYNLSDFIYNSPSERNNSELNDDLQSQQIYNPSDSIFNLPPERNKSKLSDDLQSQQIYNPSDSIFNLPPERNKSKLSDDLQSQQIYNPSDSIFNLTPERNKSKLSDDLQSQQIYNPSDSICNLPPESRNHQNTHSMQNSCNMSMSNVACCELQEGYYKNFTSKKKMKSRIIIIMHNEIVSKYVPGIRKANRDEKRIISHYFQNFAPKRQLIINCLKDHKREIIEKLIEMNEEAYVIKYFDKI